jgi:hypothetical protein
MGLSEESEEQGIGGSDTAKNMDVENDGHEASKTCSIVECDGTNIEELVWCDECELWCCKDLHGPHNSHSAQTYYKEGRFPKKSEHVPLDVVAQPPASQDSHGAGQKRKRDELALSIQTERSSDMSKLGVATRKIREILANPSKHQKDQLRSTLNFSSYDITFLTMVAVEFGIDISIVANKSRATRIQVLDYLLSMLN